MAVRRLEEEDTFERNEATLDVSRAKVAEFAEFHCGGRNEHREMAQLVLV